MARRKTLLASEVPNLHDGDVIIDDEAEKRKRVAEYVDPLDIQNSAARLPSRRKTLIGADLQTPAASRAITNATPGGPRAQDQAAKPSNEQLSSLYNNCVKLLNENKINAKNAFQLKLIDYMTDIVLNKEIAGSTTNFQVVGCTIDVGTKIYAARVDALHQNTYQMLSGLGHGANDDPSQSQPDDQSMDANENNMNENEDDASNKKATRAKKKRIRARSRILEGNLEAITQKQTEDYQGDDLFFGKISTCIENEAIAGTLLNKLNTIDDSYRVYINADDKQCSVSTKGSHYQHSPGIAISMQEIVELGRAKLWDLKNLKLCSELASFRFIGWNLETNDEISRLVESMSQPPDEDALEVHRFDANNLQTSHLNITLSQASSAAANAANAAAAGQNIADLDVDDMMGDGDDHFETQLEAASQIGLDRPANGLNQSNLYDDMRCSVNTLAELTVLINQTPSDYSYFDKLKIHDLPKGLKHLATRFNQNLLPTSSQASTASSSNTSVNSKLATVRNKREASRINLADWVDKMKFFRVTKKTTFLNDRTLEKRGEKPLRTELERNADYNARELLHPFFKTSFAKIFSDADTGDNFVVNNNDGAHQQQQQLNNLDDNNRGGVDDDDAHLGGIDDDFLIPATAATNEPFNSENGGLFMQSQQVGLDHVNNGVGLGLTNPNNFDQMQRFDGDNLIEAPMQVNALNLEYAKASKNIDVKKLKHVIWKLISNDTETDKENIDTTENNESSKRSMLQVNASLKDIYKKLRPPIITEKVFEDLSICIVFQMLLFLANEHNLLLKNDPIGSDVIITSY